MENQTNNWVKSFCGRLGIPSYYLASFFLIFIIFLFFDWFVATSLRAAKIDHYILFSLAETSRLFYAKSALHNPFVFLNPNAKPIYALVSAGFMFILPLGLLSLKILNSILSVGILVILYKLMKKMGYGDFAAAIAIIFTLTFPLFFLLSISALSEILFCLFLIGAFYCFYLKRYLISVILISLLPLIRQEGVLYLFILAFLLLKEKKIRYGLILPIPLLVWILLNFFWLKHSLIYPFLVSIDLPGPTAKNDIMSLSELRDFIPGIFYHPLFFLFPVGFLLMFLKKHCLPIILALVVHGSFIILGVITQFLILKQVSYAFRYIVPLVPFMALATAGLFNYFVLGKKSKIYIIVFITFALTGVLVNRIITIQKQPRVVAESITGEQEAAIEEAVGWLKVFIKEAKIQQIYYSGDLTGNKIIRRLKTYLADSVVMYPVKEFREVYDPITFKIIEQDFCNSSLNGLILLLDPQREQNFIASKKIKSLKTFPNIPAYFYRKYSV